MCCANTTRDFVWGSILTKGDDLPQEDLGWVLGFELEESEQEQKQGQRQWVRAGAGAGAVDQTLYLYAFTATLEVVRVQVPVMECPYRTNWIATDDEVSI